MYFAACTVHLFLWTHLSAAVKNGLVKTFWLISFWMDGTSEKTVPVMESPCRNTPCFREDDSLSTFAPYTQKELQPLRYIGQA